MRIPRLNDCPAPQPPNGAFHHGPRFATRYKGLGLLVHGDEFNPYTPPAVTAQLAAESAWHRRAALASPATRLGARILDSLMVGAVAVVFFIAAWTALSPAADGAPRSELAIAMAVVSAIPLLAFACYQYFLITTTGQTLGKRWLGIKVVKQDGSAVDFVSGVLLREWVLALVGLIPTIGGLINLVDSLMIFGSGRLCLHDHLARTRVINVAQQHA